VKVSDIVISTSIMKAMLRALHVGLLKNALFANNNKCSLWSGNVTWSSSLTARYAVSGRTFFRCKCNSFPCFFLQSSTRRSVQWQPTVVIKIQKDLIKCRLSSDRLYILFLSIKLRTNVEVLNFVPSWYLKSYFVVYVLISESVWWIGFVCTQTDF